MTQNNDGGPMFPSKAQYDSDNDNLGISFRDECAMRALECMLSDPKRPGIDLEWLAKKAYSVADAMLEARKVQP